MKTQCYFIETCKSSKSEKTTKTKLTDKIQAKLFHLKGYSSPMLEIEVGSKEGKSHTRTSSVMFTINNVVELEAFIAELQKLKPKLPGYVELKTCQRCHVCNSTVQTVIDPYRKGLYDEEVEVDLCPSCENEKRRDV